VALTLRTLGGLTTEEIARAFLVQPETMKRRLTRAKDKVMIADPLCRASGPRTPRRAPGGERMCNPADSRFLPVSHYAGARESL
jgi:predicted RNA polymerase sigma factor